MATQMHALLLSGGLYAEVTDALANAGRADLAKKLNEAERSEAENLTSTEVAELLGVSSANTIKNWITGGWFPGAFKTAGGHWRFPRAAVQHAAEQLAQLREQNAKRDLTPADSDSDPPLL